MNTTVGFTSPATTYEKMRRVDTAARILNDDIRAYVTNPAFREAYERWYTRWREFYDRTMGEKVSNVFRSDEIAELTGGYEQDLARYQESYSAERDAQGRPLPSHSPKVPVTPPPSTDDKKEEGIPLWHFLLGVGVIGAGVFAYYTAKRMMQVRSAIEKDVLPIAMGATMGPAGVALARAAAHDPSPSTCGCSRDLEVVPAAPRAYAKYILSGF